MNSSLLDLRDAAAQTGEKIYDQQFQALESEQFGRFIAIHIPTHEYFIGDSMLEVADMLRNKYPDAGPGEVYTRRIGNRATVHAHTPRITNEP